MTDKIKTLSILGAGGHGRVIADCAFESGRWRQVNFYDDNVIGEVGMFGTAVIGTAADLFDTTPSDSQQLIIGIGAGSLRWSLQQKLESLGWCFATVIHPQAVVSRHASLGSGTCVMAGAIVNCGANTGRSCIINTRSSIDHDCCLGDGVHISPGATLAGNVSVGNHSWIGAGAIIIEGLTVGADATVGAGSTVIRPVPPQTISYGCPSKVVKDRRR